MIRISKKLERLVDINQYIKYLLWPYIQQQTENAM